MNPVPKFTVAVLVYNTGSYVVSALECLARQTFTDFEVVVIDDASTDGSDDVVGDWLSRHERMPARFIRNDRNRGIPGALNQAIGMTSGDLVTWICDDLWEDDRLARVAGAFALLPESASILFGDAVVIDSAGHEIGYLSPAASLTRTGASVEPSALPAPGELRVLPRSAVYDALFYRCFFPTPSVSVRRTLYERVGLYDETLPIEDLDCWFRSAAHADFAYLRVPLVRYRRHASNLTSGQSDAYLSGLAAILNRHAAGGARSRRRAVHRHLREECYRVALALLTTGLPRAAARAVRGHYLPHLQPTMTCAKETTRLAARFTTTALRSRRSAAVR